MAQKEEKKYYRALTDLQDVLVRYDKAHDDELAVFLAVAKAFEISVEYSWKEFKRILEDKGVDDVFAPKDVIRKAAQAGLIDDAQKWLDYVDARNDSVHDYYAMTQSEYVSLAQAFLKDAKKALGI